MAASTQRQALAAILFLYRQVLGLQLPWLDNVTRAKQPQHLPRVLSQPEVLAVLRQLPRTSAGLAVALVYGTGMRRSDVPHLRLHDLRHTAASEMVAAGEDLAAVGAVLGHKSAQSTKRYTHYALPRLATAVGKIGQRPAENSPNPPQRKTAR